MESKTPDVKNASIAILQELCKQLGEVVRQLVTQFSIPELQRKHILDELKDITPSQNPQPADTPVKETPVKKETPIKREASFPTETPSPKPSSIIETPSTETPQPISLASLIDPVNLSSEVTPHREFHC